MSEQNQHFYEFGPFRLNPLKRRLLRDGEPMRLTPKAFDLLVVLVEESGRTIEKDQLLERVWAGTAVEENNLNQNIQRSESRLETAGRKASTSRRFPVLDTGSWRM